MADAASLQRELNRLALSHSDLTLAVQCSVYLREHDLLASRTFTLDRGDGLLTVALQHSMIVSYCRPHTQRRDRSGKRETEDYLARAFRQSFSAQEAQFHHRLLEVRDQVVGHSDASTSETTIRADPEHPYVVHNWAGRRMLGPGDLPVVEEMIHKLRTPLRYRLDDVKAALVEARNKQAERP